MRNEPQAELDDLDRLIDGAVASYSATEPRPGLTHRVIANTISATPSESWLTSAQRVFRSLPLTRVLLSAAAPRVPHVSHLRRGFFSRYGLAAALLVVCGVTFWSVEHAHRQHLAGVTARITPPKAGPTSALPTANPMIALEQASPTSLRLSPHVRRFTPKPNPAQLNAEPTSKSEVFPTPAPLTSEERALITLATKVPEEVQQSLAKSAIQADQPINIAAIHVEPLTPLIQPSPVNTPSTLTP
jgi:hypothetical protein